MKPIAGLVVALAAAVSLAGCGGEEDANTIPIAMVGPVTGENAAFGAQMKNGGELAVEDINAAGGVLGKKLDLSIGDDACYAEQAVAVANQMTASNVVLVVGHYCSSSSIAASKVYAKSNMVQISPASTNPTLTDDPAPTSTAFAAVTINRGVSPASISQRTSLTRTLPSSMTTTPTAKASPKKRRRRSTQRANRK